MKRLVNILVPVIFVFAVIYLGWRIVDTGITYNYDFDELQNAQTVYLVAHGEIPFKSFFSVYSPVFHLLLVPVLAVWGYSYSGLYALRIVMVILLIARIILLFLFARKILGKTGAYVAGSLLILDPFMHFTGIQIRPDNLMMTVFCAGLLPYADGIKTGKFEKFFWAGMIFSASAVISLKIMPSLAVIYLAVLLRQSVTRHLKPAFVMLAGSVIPVALFSLRCIGQGSFSAMFQQLVFDAGLTNATRLYPTHPSYYYMANEFLYGMGGKTPLWIYFTVLPALALSGYLLAVFGRKNTDRSGAGSFFTVTLLLLTAINWIYIYTIPSAFIQYFIPLTWLYPFGVAVLYDYFRNYPLPGLIKLNGIIVLLILYFITWNSAVKSNIERKGLASDAIQKRYIWLWTQIPDNARVFPGMLFRPLSYPVQYGYFVVELPKSILDRYPSFTTTLMSPDVRYAMISDYMLGFMDSESKQYIATHFTKVAGDPELMVKSVD